MIHLPQVIHIHLLTQHMMRLQMWPVRQDTREQLILGLLDVWSLVSGIPCLAVP